MQLWRQDSKRFTVLRFIASVPQSASTVSQPTCQSLATPLAPAIMQSSSLAASAGGDSAPVGTVLQSNTSATLSSIVVRIRHQPHVAIRLPVQLFLKWRHQSLYYWRWGLSPANQLVEHGLTSWKNTVGRVPESYIIVVQYL